MNYRFCRAALTAACLTAALATAGCNSCEPPPPPPQPVPQEGKLPRAPEAAKPLTPIVAEPSCVVVATADIDEGPAPLKVQLSAEGMCTDADGDYEWTFGDDTATVKGPTATHTYTKPGTYTANVKISDTAHNVGDTDEASITVSQP